MDIRQLCKDVRHYFRARQYFGIVLSNHRKRAHLGGLRGAQLEAQARHSAKIYLAEHYENALLLEKLQAGMSDEEFEAHKASMKDFAGTKYLTGELL